MTENKQPALEVVAWRTETGYEQPFYLYHSTMPDRWINLQAMVLESDALALLAERDAEIARLLKSVKAMGMAQAVSIGLQNLRSENEDLSDSTNRQEHGRANPCDLAVDAVDKDGAGMEGGRERLAVAKLQARITEKDAEIERRCADFGELSQKYVAMQARIAELERRPDYQEDMYSVGAYAAELLTENAKLQARIAELEQQLAEQSEKLYRIDECATAGVGSWEHPEDAVEQCELIGILVAGSLKTDVEDARKLREEVARLTADLDNIKQVEFPKHVQNVADGWKGKCERLEADLAAAQKDAERKGLALAKIEYSMSQALIPGNDKWREIFLSKGIADAAIQGEQG